MVEQCYAAGASRVYVFDNVVLPTTANARNCYMLSGIEETAKAARAVVVPVDDFSYRKVEIPDGKTLKTAEVHSLIFDADVFINVPVLKHHSSAHLSIAMKNLILLSRDIVAVDAAAARIFGREPEEIGYIKMAHAQKIGNMNLKELKI